MNDYRLRYLYIRVSKSSIDLPRVFSEITPHRARRWVSIQDDGYSRHVVDITEDRDSIYEKVSHSAKLIWKIV